MKQTGKKVTNIKQNSLISSHQINEWKIKTKEDLNN